VPEPPPRSARRRVAVTGLGVLSACGRGPEPLAAAIRTGKAAFGPVGRFGTAGRAVHDAAQLPGSPDLAEELLAAIGAARTQAGLVDGSDDDTPVLLALHADTRTAAITEQVGRIHSIENVYTCACVAASTAVADAAARIAWGLCDRIVVAAGYLVEPDTFAVFDAGRALARDGQARPFSAGRGGLMLGDGVSAVVLEAEATARDRGAQALGWIAGWGRTGDAYHVCRPIPDGSGLARAIEAALGRAALAPHDIGYVNANATGAALADSAEVSALRTAFGDEAERIPVSSTKSVHGHALEGSALLELVATILTLDTGTLPVNAGYLGPDEPLLDLVLTPGRTTEARYALSLNSAFGGANTALVVQAP
jgi:3-oxoacyl-[acyl-carrier-protein] synthase II